MASPTLVPRFRGQSYRKLITVTPTETTATRILILNTLFSHTTTEYLSDRKYYITFVLCRRLDCLSLRTLTILKNFLLDTKVRTTGRLDTVYICYLYMKMS